MSIPADRHDPILVPVDFSDCAANALALAGELAEHESNPLVVLHVVHDSTGKEDIYRRELTPQRAPLLPMTDIAGERLRKLMDDTSERHPELKALRGVRTVLVDGLPVNRILEVAEREGAGMIVMGSHGRNGLSRMLMGSVAEAVTRKARVPVTIVKEPKTRIQ